jgi:hypothetical protein
MCLCSKGEQPHVSPGRDCRLAAAAMSTTTTSSVICCLRSAQALAELHVPSPARARAPGRPANPVTKELKIEREIRGVMSRLLKGVEKQVKKDEADSKVVFAVVDSLVRVDMMWCYCTYFS